MKRPSLFQSAQISENVNVVATPKMFWTMRYLENHPNVSMFEAMDIADLYWSDGKLRKTN